MTITKNYPNTYNNENQLPLPLPLNLKLYYTEKFPSSMSYRYKDVRQIPPYQHFQVIENIGDNKWVRYLYNSYEDGSDRRVTEVWTTFKNTGKWDKGVENWWEWPFPEIEKEYRWNQVIQFLRDEGHL